jgi:ribosomal protein S12 methylthiotransferase
MSSTAPRELRVHIRTLGCPKNVVDTELTMGGFEAQSWTIVDRPEEADVLVVNTCGFIGEARQASVEAILEMAEIKKVGDDQNLVVTGCLSQMFSGELSQSIPEVDLFLGSGNASGVVEEVTALRASAEISEPRIRVGRPGTLYDPDTPRIPTGPVHSAYIKIAEGCSQRCSFCIIPQLRGKARSRSVSSVVGEVRALAQRGVREFNVIAQDLTHFGDDRKDGTSLAALVEAIAEVEGTRWIRLMYCYPHGMGPDLLKHFAPGGALVPYIDMPLQHIDDEMLVTMRRRFSEADTRTLLNELRQINPELFLRTTFLVGFPGEQRGHVQRLTRFVREFGFDHSGAFAYSFEEKTKSGRMERQVPEATRRRRADRLGEVLREASIQRAQSRLGQIQEAVVESTGPDANTYIGRHWGQAPEIDGHTTLHWSGEELLPGTFVQVRLTHTNDLDMVAEVLHVLERPVRPRQRPRFRIA